jgi:GntR family transcriptional regulator
MTVSKAYSLLEREGAVERVRGQGMRINQVAPAGGVRDRQRDLLPLLEQVVARAYQLGLNRQQVLAALNPLLTELGDG